MSKIKITEHPELTLLCKQYIDGDREDKQIVWMEMADLCLEKSLNHHLFFEEYCRVHGVGLFEGQKKKKKARPSNREMKRMKKR